MLEWKEILPKVRLAPSRRHLYKIPATGRTTYVRLRIYPDGGIVSARSQALQMIHTLQARFRVYGHVVPVIPASPVAPFDLAHIFAGGKVVATSDDHFGSSSNLLLPGRGQSQPSMISTFLKNIAGVDMGDGWETKRSRAKDHQDWVVIKLYVSCLVPLLHAVKI